jgi:hypothetical protein
MKSKKITTVIATLVSTALATQLVGCGTILYPERKGQIDGRIDPGVAVLDATGLLFFFVPGVIAFAVDFSNGTIYLPGGKRAKLTSSELKSITDDKKLNSESLSKIISSKINISINLQSPNAKIVRLHTEKDILARIAISESQLAKL